MQICNLTNVVYCGEVLKSCQKMSWVQSRDKTTPLHSVRASISFPPAIYQALENIAKRKKVSLAWVVREASEKYIAGLRPSPRKQSFE